MVGLVQPEHGTTPLWIGTEVAYVGWFNNRAIDNESGKMPAELENTHRHPTAGVPDKRICFKPGSSTSLSPPMACLNHRPAG